MSDVCNEADHSMERKMTFIIIDNDEGKMLD